MKSLVAVCLVGILVTACGPAPTPRKPLDPDVVYNNITWQNGTEQCIRKGWGDVASLVAYRDDLRLQLSSTPKAQIQAQISRANNTKGIPNIRPEDCRSIAAKGYTVLQRKDAYIKHRQEQQRQQEAFNNDMDSMIQANQPRYTSCSSYAGNTTCVNF